MVQSRDELTGTALKVTRDGSSEPACTLFAKTLSDLTGHNYSVAYSTSTPYVLAPAGNGLRLHTDTSESAWHPQERDTYDMVEFSLQIPQQELGYTYLHCLASYYYGDKKPTDHVSVNLSKSLKSIATKVLRRLVTLNLDTVARRFEIIREQELSASYTQQYFETLTRDLVEPLRLRVDDGSTDASSYLPENYLSVEIHTHSGMPEPKASHNAVSFSRNLQYQSPELARSILEDVAAEVTASHTNVAEVAGHEN